MVGGTLAGAANLIAGNNGNGVGISNTLGTGASNNLVEGNDIGVTAGMVAAGNSAAGVSIQGGNNNTIGGASAAARNVIATNAGNGVEIYGASASGNQIEGNWIGFTGTAAAVGNTGDGVFISNAVNNTIGGITAGSGNVISGNSNGLEILNNTNNPGNASGNVLLGNFIGTDAAGTATTITTKTSSGTMTASLGNQTNGVLDIGAPQIMIGMPLAGGPGPINLGGNSISGNAANGIDIAGQTAKQVSIQANFIGTDVTGTIALGNAADGIFFAATIPSGSSAGPTNAGPTNNTVGGSIPGTGNLISGNLGNGIEISGNGTTQDTIQGNSIGTNLAGAAALSNLGSGVLLEGVSGNLIGGTTGTNPDGNLSGAGNVISGNVANGIGITSLTAGSTTATPDSNVIEGNYIGTDVTGQKPLGNGQVGTSNVTGAGILLDAATNTTIGGITPAARNVVSGNRGGGIAIQDGSFSSVVEGNYVGTDSTGSFTDPEGNLTDADEPLQRHPARLRVERELFRRRRADHRFARQRGRLAQRGEPRRGTCRRRQLDRGHHGAGGADRGKRFAGQPGAEQLHRHERDGHQGDRGAGCERGDRR